MPASLLYVVGYVIFTAGLAYAAHLIGLSQAWITALVLVFIGLGVAKAARVGQKKIH